MSVSRNMVLTRSIFGIPRPEVKCDMHLSDRERLITSHLLAPMASRQSLTIGKA